MTRKRAAPARAPRPPYGGTLDGGSAAFRWPAPASGTLRLFVSAPDGERELELTHDDGDVVARADGLGVGARYRLERDGVAVLDPFALHLPDGEGGPVALVDPGRLIDDDPDWGGPDPTQLVLYEAHVGTATRDGTFRALATELPALADLGVNALLLLPLAEFPGRRGWGDVTVAPLAPESAYGAPADLAHLVGEAQRHGIAVLATVDLDRWSAVYRDWLGPDEGRDGRASELAREAATRWLRAYRLDGLAISGAADAPGRSAALADLARRARAASGGRTIVLIDAANDDDASVLANEDSTNGLDALVVDDFQRALRALLVGDREGVYRGYAGTAAEVVRIINEGYLFQGQFSRRAKRARGTPPGDRPPWRFVFALERAASVGERAFGERLHHQVGRGVFRAASALLLSLPQVPLLFQGQEFATSAPFLAFGDLAGAAGESATAARRDSFKGQSAFKSAARRAEIPDPQSVDAFERSRLDPAERESHADVLRLYRDLLALRRDDRVLAQTSGDDARAYALGERVLILHRWLDDEHRLLVFNFGEGISVDLASDDALADLPDRDWVSSFSTETQEYGGVDLAARQRRRGERQNLEIPAHGAFMLTGRKRRARAGAADDPDEPRVLAPTPAAPPAVAAPEERPAAGPDEGVIESIGAPRRAERDRRWRDHGPRPPGRAAGPRDAADGTEDTSAPPRGRRDGGRRHGGHPSHEEPTRDFDAVDDVEVDDEDRQPPDLPPAGRGDRRFDRGGRGGQWRPRRPGEGWQGRERGSFGDRPESRRERFDGGDRGARPPRRGGFDEGRPYGPPGEGRQFGPRGARRPPPTPGRRPPAGGPYDARGGGQRDFGDRGPRDQRGGFGDRAQPPQGGRGIISGRPPSGFGPPGSQGPRGGRSDVWSRGPGGNLGPWRNPPPPSGRGPGGGRPGDPRQRGGHGRSPGGGFGGPGQPRGWPGDFGGPGQPRGGHGGFGGPRRGPGGFGGPRRGGPGGPDRGDGGPPRRGGPPRDGPGGGSGGPRRGDDRPRRG